MLADLFGAYKSFVSSLRYVRFLETDPPNEMWTQLLYGMKLELPICMLRSTLTV
jgi:hypothetical protein